MFNGQAYANTKTRGVAILEVAPHLAAGETRSPSFVPLKRTLANGRWDGPLAEITVAHTYGYTRQQCAQTLEAVYRFPLPGDAAVRKVVITFGDVEITAALEERKQAQAEYAEARRQGHQAALVTRESPDVFTLSITGLKPDEEIVVETTYVQLAQPSGTGWTLRLPLTTAPRFTRGDESGSPAANGQPLAVARDPGHRFALDVLIPSSGTVESSTHALDVSAEDDFRRVRLSEGEVLPDRDCVLTWRPTQEPDRPSLHVLSSEDKTSGYTYFMALVAPPSVLREGAGVAREATILVDHSGSMSGAKWQAADWAALKFLGDLTERDQYALGVFDDDTRWLRHKVALATRSTIADGERFLKASPDGGGTSLGVALEQALRMPRGKDERSRQVVILTDAQVTDYGRITQLLDAEAKDPNRRRVSIVCIDAAPNSFLAQEIARRGGGIARFLTSDPNEGDVTTALADIVEGWVQPVLTGLRLEVNRAKLEAPEHEVVAGSESEWSAIDLGDLVAGRAVWVAGRVPTQDASGLAFRLTGASGSVVESWRTKTRSTNSGALKALFGAWKILAIESLQESWYEDLAEMRDILRRLGYDPEEVLGEERSRRPVYHENAVANSRELLSKLLVSESLEYGLLSSATGFVAVRKEKGEVVAETMAIANALPGGWAESFAGFHARMASGAAPLAWPMAAPTPAPTSGPESFDMSARTDSAMADIEAEFAPPLPSAPTRRPGSSGSPRKSLWARALRRNVAGHPSDSGPDRPVGPSGVVVFSGAVPPLVGREAALFDSDRPEDGARLDDLAHLSLLSVRFGNGTPRPEDVDPALTLVLYVGDMAEPVARVSLVDLIRQGGRRPLNVTRLGTERVRLALDHPESARARGLAGLEIEVALG